MSSKYQRSKCVPYIFRIGHQKRFQVDNELGIQTDLNKHRYHTLCLEPRKGSKSKTMTMPQKHIDFAKDKLARIVTAE